MKTPVSLSTYVYVRFGDLPNMGTDYCKAKACLIIDDMLVAVKGKVMIGMFDTHMEKRWAMQKFKLDGFLNNQFYSNIFLHTVTMCMDVRITEIIKEHLPDEMAKSWQDSIQRRRAILTLHWLNLTLTMPKLAADRAKASHRPSPWMPAYCTWLCRFTILLSSPFPSALRSSFQLGTIGVVRSLKPACSSPCLFDAPHWAYAWW